jgi:hypothetical protein
LIADQPTDRLKVSMVSDDDAITVRREELVIVAVMLVWSLSAAWSLVLAYAGVWSFVLWAVGATVACALVALLWWVPERRDAVSIGTAGRALLVLAVALTAIVSFPGFRSGMAGWDPGVYVTHARWIAESSTIDLPNPAVELGLSELPAGVTVVYPGIIPADIADERMAFSFFHLYPASAAPPYALARSLGVATVNPVLGLLGVAAMFLLGRRLGGLIVGGVAALFLGSSLVWVWHARLPSSEMSAATAGLAFLLSALLALDTRRPRWALAAGLLLSTVALSRADGFVLLVLGSVGIGVVAALGHLRMALSGALGAAPGFLLYLFQVGYFSSAYAAAHSVPPLALLAAMTVIPVVGGWVLHGYSESLRPLAERFTEVLGNGRLIRTVLLVAVGLILLVLWWRAVSLDPSEAGLSVYRQRAILWLVMFLGPPAAALVIVGLAWSLRSGPFRLLLVLAPGLLVAPIYLYDPRISPRLIWWTRRFVPQIWPMLALLVGIGVLVAAVWLQRRVFPRRPGAVLLAVTALTSTVVGFQLRWTVPLQSHREFDGALEYSAQLAEAVRDFDAVLWVHGETFSAFSVPVRVISGTPIIPIDSSEQGAVDVLARQLCDHRVVLLSDSMADVDLADLAESPRRVADEFPFLGIRYERVPTEVDLMAFVVEVAELERADQC